MSRRDLAVAAKISYPYLSQFLAGQRNVSLTKLYNISEALGLKLSDILERAESLPELPN
jgi:transcriptional regulator with XRE-family HTH domain